MKIFRKNICLFPPNLASLRLCGRHIRIRESSIIRKFTQAARYAKHVGLSFWIVILIKNSLLRVLRASALKIMADPSFGGSAV